MMSTDLFIIHYAKQDGHWSAFSANTLKSGVGDTPHEALGTALAASERRGGRHSNAPSRALIQTLTSIAEPLRDGEYSTEAVYKHEHAWSE